MKITTITRALLPALLLATTGSAIASSTAGPAANGMTAKVGTYRCELGKRLEVSNVSADQQTAVLKWNKRDYTMRAVDARSGALRYEDTKSGLVWLMIPSKSMLLDSKHGQRLADECKI